MQEAMEEIRRVNPELATLFSGIEREHSRAVFARTVAIISVIALAIVGWFSAEQYSKAQDAANSAKQAAAVVRTSALQSCRASTQPGGVRYIIAQQIRADIDQSKHLDYSTFFPNVPQDQLKSLIESQRQRQEAQIKALLGVDCPALYPKL